MRARASRTVQTSSPSPAASSSNRRGVLCSRLSLIVTMALRPFGMGPSQRKAQPVEAGRDRFVVMHQRHAEVAPAGIAAAPAARDIGARQRADCRLAPEAPGRLLAVA